MTRRRPLTVALAGLLAAGAWLPAAAWELAGRHDVRLHPRSGDPVTIGTLTVSAADDRQMHTFELTFAREVFQDHFLSMREFKCIDGADELHCRVPYPYANPRQIDPTDYSWLEHALLFFYKTPREFGANLWNGLYYRLERTPEGLAGTPQAIDLNLIAAPPEDPALPPFEAGLRSEIDPTDRAFIRLTIE